MHEIDCVVPWISRVYWISTTEGSSMYSPRAQNHHYYNSRLHLGERGAGGARPHWLQFFPLGNRTLLYWKTKVGTLCHGLWLISQLFSLLYMYRYMYMHMLHDSNQSVSQSTNQCMHVSGHAATVNTISQFNVHKWSCIILDKCMVLRSLSAQ